MTILVYPKEKGAADPVVLTRGDKERLQPFEFLNDNLVDFYLKFMLRERECRPTRALYATQSGTSKSERNPTDLDEGDPYNPPEMLPETRVSQVHIFTAHFYKKLTGRQESGEYSDDDSDYGEDSVTIAHGRKRGRSGVDRGAAAHSMVARWTKDIDLFECRFVFIPIVEHLHWSLATVANLDSLEEHFLWTQRMELRARESETSQTASKAKARISEASAKCEREDRMDEDPGKNALLIDMSNSDSEAATPADVGPSGPDDDADLWEQSSQEEVSTPPVVPSPCDDEPRIPCLIFMDSLNMHAASAVASNIRAYLKHEYRAKRKSSRRARVRLNGTADQSEVTIGDERSKTGGCNDVADAVDNEAFDSYVERLFGNGDGCLPLLRPPVPKQSNCSDCGIFTLQYTEEILLRFPFITSKDIRARTIAGFSSTMFTMAQMAVRFSNLKFLYLIKQPEASLVTKKNLWISLFPLLPDQARGPH